MTPETSTLSECIQFLRFVVAGLEETSVCEYEKPSAQFLWSLADPYLVSFRLSQVWLLENIDDDLDAMRNIPAWHRWQRFIYGSHSPPHPFAENLDSHGEIGGCRDAYAKNRIVEQRSR